MVDNITRWKLQEINQDNGSFLVFDSLYGNTNIYSLSDLISSSEVRLEDAFVSGAFVYLVMSNSKGLEINLLTKEIKSITKKSLTKEEDQSPR